MLLTFLSFDQQIRNLVLSGNEAMFKIGDELRILKYFCYSKGRTFSREQSTTTFHTLHFKQLSASDEVLTENANSLAQYACIDFGPFYLIRT